MRYFNTEGVCRPKEHYMVCLDERLEQIKRLYVDRGKYFMINRGRQYGKTTTLKALAGYLKDDYMVVSMDFQGIGTEEFVDADTFVRAFAKMFLNAFMEEKRAGLLNALEKFADNGKSRSMRELFEHLSRICADADKPLVLMIDEVDSASNNQVFIDFLAQLRTYYLNRESSPLFHSVILVGVYDIKNLKLKIRPDSEHQYNSSWNIAAQFKMNMNFSAEQIAAMLNEYEADHQTGMCVDMAADEIYQYTAGYPYLVSAVCKCLDEEVPDNGKFESLSDVWSKQALQKPLSFC